MNSFIKKYGNITLWEFERRKREFKKEYDYIKRLPNYREEIRSYKEFIYSLAMAEYKRDKIWEYLNDDLTEIGLYEFVRGVYTGGRYGFDKKK